MGMSKLFRKRSEISALFDEKWTNKTLQRKKRHYGAQLNGVQSISAKSLAIQNLLRKRDSKNSICFTKNPEVNFSEKSSLKKTLVPENLEVFRSWARRSVFPKIEWILQMHAKEKKFEETKRRVTSRKKRNHFGVSSCE